MSSCCTAYIEESPDEDIIRFDLGGTEHMVHGYLVLFELKKSDAVPWEERIRWADEAYEGKRISVVEM